LRLGAIESRIAGPPRGARPRGKRDRLNRRHPVAAAGPAGIDRLGETEPRSLAGTGNMIDARTDVPGPFPHSLPHREERRGEIDPARGRAVLIDNDPNDLLLVGELEHAGEEVPAARTVDPRGAHDERRRVGGEDRLLTVRLRATVDAERRRSIFLNVWRSL